MLFVQKWANDLPKLATQVEGKNLHAGEGLLFHAFPICLYVKEENILPQLLAGVGDRGSHLETMGQDSPRQDQPLEGKKMSKSQRNGFR